MLFGYSAPWQDSGVDLRQVRHLFAVMEHRNMLRAASPYTKCAAFSLSS
jgi:hypothetical protein